MIVRKTNGEELTLRAKTEVSFEKIGRPGQRRWYAVFTPVALTRGGVGKELKIPVREVRSIKGGIRKAKQMSEIIKREFVTPPPTNKTLTVTLQVTEREREILRGWIGKRSGRDIQNELTAMPYEYDLQSCARYIKPPSWVESDYLINVLYKLFEPE